MSDITIRLSFFLGILFILIIAEILLPKKTRVHKRKDRWITNGLITIINTVSINVVNILITFVAVLAAIDVSYGNWGLFNIINYPSWLEILLIVIR